MGYGGLTPFADGVWTDTTVVRHLGLHLSATMTVLRLPDGGLLLHSPAAATPERRAAVDALGAVTHLYAPNTYHHLHVGAWADAYPAAKLHAPAGLAKKRPDLRIDRVHTSAPEPAFADALDERRIDGFRLEETVLYHRPSRTLLVADLVHNIGDPSHAWTRTYARLMGFHERVALSRMLRWAAFSDRVAARRSVDDVLALPFEQILVGHGEPVRSDARRALAEAYAWLPEPRRVLSERPGASGCA